jgi:hypothetical protein
MGVQKVVLKKRNAEGGFDTLVPTNGMDSALDKYVQDLEHSEKTLRARVAQLEDDLKPRALLSQPTYYYIACTTREYDGHALGNSTVFRIHSKFHELPLAAKDKFIELLLRDIEDVEDDEDLIIYTAETETYSGRTDVVAKYDYWEDKGCIRITPLVFSQSFDFNTDIIKFGGIFSTTVD